MVFIVFVCVIAFGFVAFVLARATRPDERDDDGDDGPPGRGWRRPRPKPRGPEPSWWPEFEREFRAYVRATSRSPRAPRVRA